MATNEILPFAQGGGANVQSQVDYAAEPLRSSGNVAGIARSSVNNKALRQASVIAAGIAQFMADRQANNITDSATPANISAWLALAVSSVSSPAGAVLLFSQNTAPSGWLKANGAAVSRTTYANLFAAIGTTFGAGDGSTTFNLPDLRGEFLRGWDDGRGVDSGRAFGSTQADQLKSHSHQLDSEGVRVGTGAVAYVADAYGFGTSSEYFPTASTGGAETRPRNVALLACIKF